MRAMIGSEGMEEAGGPGADRSAWRAVKTVMMRSEKALGIKNSIAAKIEREKHAEQFLRLSFVAKSMSQQRAAQTAIEVAMDLAAASEGIVIARTNMIGSCWTGMAAGRARQREDEDCVRGAISNVILQTK